VEVGNLLPKNQRDVLPLAGNNGVGGVAGVPLVVRFLLALPIGLPRVSIPPVYPPTVTAHRPACHDPSLALSSCFRGVLIRRLSNPLNVAVALTH